MNYQEFLSKITTYNLDYYLLATKCEFDVEYLPDYAKNLEKITGFDGSNGFCFISKEKIIFITDGRYITQAEQQLKKLNTKFIVLNIADLDLSSQLKEQFPNKSNIGFDPKIFTKKTLERFQNESIEYIPICIQIDNFQKNTINQRNVFTYEIEFSGESYQSKMLKFVEKMQNDFYFFNNPASICWLLNIRGFDIEYNLVFLCYGILGKHTKTLTIFCYDENKLEKIKNHENIKIENISKLEDHLIKITELEKNIGTSNNISIHYSELLKKSLKIEQDYCSSLRSYKNNTEIENTKKIHLDDAIAFIKFWYFFESKDKDETFDEISVSKTLENFRSEEKNCISSSFETIVGFKENGAIIHYKPFNETNKKISGDGLLLIDSGGHYYGGTTDVTRVLSIGIPTDEEKFHYTLVLKAHLKLLNSYFPKNIPMHQLNSLSRYALWQEKLDFDHGLGHGVSNCIEVHEGPYSINNRCGELLIENLILSNEPGLYFENKYGIRIENLMHSKISNNKENKQFIEFENLTMIPYETKLIEKSMLDNKEIIQINNYHTEIFLKLEKSLDKKILDWLKNRINKL
jgi:Xaa-Pro aminopeptidase